MTETAANTQNGKLFLDVDWQQRCKAGQIACGDMIVSRRSPDGRVMTVALSDGLGSGIKANILSTMTAVMALKFAEGGMEFPKAAETMMKALPVCSVRKISYATFSLAVWMPGKMVKIIEMGNPSALFLRDDAELDVRRRVFSSDEWEGRKITVSEFVPKDGDRIVMMSDGISQAGMGSSSHPLGWRRSGCVSYCLDLLKHKNTISSREMSFAVVERALSVEESGMPGDDMTCAVLHFRQPRELLVVTGPPFREEHDAEWAKIIDGFSGTKVICGGTTAKIAARELNREMKVILNRSRGSDFPPAAEMSGFGMVTEGIITLTRAAQILEGREAPKADDPASRLSALIRDHDSIQFLVGTKINDAHQDPSVPAEIEVRRAVIKRLDAVLSEKFLKEVKVKYI